MQYALLQHLSICTDSSDAYAVERHSEYQCFLGLLVQMAILQVMADCMSSAAASVWSKRGVEDLHYASVYEIMLQL